MAATSPSPIVRLKGKELSLEVTINCDLAFATAICDALIHTSDLGAACHKTTVDERRAHDCSDFLTRIPEEGAHPEKPNNDSSTEVITAVDIVHHHDKKESRESCGNAYTENE